MTKTSIHFKLLAGKASINSVKGFLCDIDAIAKSNEVTIQAVDASKIADRQHVERAVRQALRSFADQRNIAANLGIEILLNLSACRQIQKALNLGIQEGEMDVLFIIVGTQRAIERSVKRLSQLIVVDARVMDFLGAKREALMLAFNITEEEVRAVGGPHRIPELIHERLALFDAFES